MTSMRPFLPCLSSLPGTKKILDKLRVEREAQSVRINKLKEGMGST